MTDRLRLALITTIWEYRSHANHMGARFLNGYPRRGRWHRPDMEIAGVYVDQVTDGDDLSRRHAETHGFGVYETIAEALRLGGDRLAVDGVLLIGEHGDYPVNDKGQKLYPRYEFFEQILDVFRADGRAVPVFNDKHLSYSFEKARRMVEASRELEFPLLAGSSLPVTYRLPPVELPLGCGVAEALMVGCGNSDAMDYHALEAMQCMIERRRGGETGVAAVQYLAGEEVWRAGDDGRWSWQLLEAAVSRSDTPCGATLEDGRTQDLVGSGEVKRLAEKPEAYLIEFRDGLRATLLLINGAIRDCCFAAQLRGDEDPVSTQIFLTPVPPVTYSAALVAKIVETIVTGEAAFPAERTLTVNGIQEACLRSKGQGGERLETPHLAVTYRPPAASHHARR